MLNPVVAELWAKDLESGRHKQCKQRLCRVDGDEKSWCCLGRLCALYNEHHPDNPLPTKLLETPAGLVVQYGETHYSLPIQVARWIGSERRHDVVLYIENYHLWEQAGFLNDIRGFTFPQIAAAIRATVVKERS